MMTSLAAYLFFIAVLSGYRASGSWPKSITSLLWLGNYAVSAITAFAGTSLLLSEWSITTGLLLALCLYTALLCSVIFFVNCNKRIRTGSLLIFHLICILGLFFST